MQGLAGREILTCFLSSIYSGGEAICVHAEHRHRYTHPLLGSTRFRTCIHMCHVQTLKHSYVARVSHMHVVLESVRPLQLKKFQ